MRRLILALSALGCLTAATLPLPAGAATILIELDLLEGDYVALPDQKSQTVVHSGPFFRARSMTLLLEAQSACAGVSPCDPASSFRFSLGGLTVNIDPFDDVLDLELDILFFRPLSLLGGESLHLTLGLGRLPDAGPLFPLPSAAATVSRAAIVLEGDILVVPEPGRGWLALGCLAVALGLGRRSQG